MIMLLKNLSLILLFSFALVLSANAADIYVSALGSDNNSGTRTQPLLTVNMAVRKAREIRRLAKKDIAEPIRIVILGGSYTLHDPVVIRSEDSGTEQSPLIIEGIPSQKTTINGGIEVKGWRKVSTNIRGLPIEANGRVWVAKINDMDGRYPEFRQLWINGNKAIKARDRDPDHMQRILSWDHKNESCTIPSPQAKSLINAKETEMFIQQWWAIAILRIKTIQFLGDSARLTFQQPESRIQSEHPWPAPWISKETGNSPFYLSNAIQFLDNPGEWFFDRSSGNLYYIPRPGEDMNHASVIIPNLETLVKLEGSIDHPVTNVVFRGIQFAYTGYLRPSHQGYVPHQAGMFMLDAYKLKIPGTSDKITLENQAWIGRPSAAIQANYTNRTSFIDCVFQHMASTAVDYEKGGHHDLLKGNLFKDIGGSAVLAGVFSDESNEIHMPYEPSDKREINTDFTIADNLINNATNEDWSCAGIAAGYVSGININHNEICNVSYTGISLGWGWTKTITALRNNKVIGNKIHHYARYLYDVSGIYTLSAQPGTIIAENYIDSIYRAPSPHDPHHWFYLYADEGSSYISFINNRTPTDKFLRNSNGPGNLWRDNGPSAPDSVRRNAGLEIGYRNLLSYRENIKDTLINHLGYDWLEDHPQIIEITDTAGRNIDINKIQILCTENGIPASSVYTWNNKVVIWGYIPKIARMKMQLSAMVPGARIKLFSDVVYNFSAKKNCPGTRAATEWDNVILTVDLINDKKLQEEYLNYHAHQFTEWPEVANGFCNANFQQLLMFKSGNQLMLVISIPKGMDFNQLNPKTTENNPRVDEWNKRMKRYQKSVPGAKPNESWVQFNQVKF